MTKRETVRNVDAQTGQVAEATQGEGDAVGNREPQAKDERHERIMDYLRSSLAMKDPLAANVGAVNADLMAFAHCLQRAITRALDMAPTALDEFEKLMPAIDSHMRISRQVERLTKLNQQLARAEQVPQVVKRLTFYGGTGATGEETES